MSDTEKLRKKLDKLAEDASFIVANPKTLEKLRASGIPIESKFISYKEYLDKLFEEKKKNAYEIIENFPPISKDIANASVKSLYEEIRECYALGLFGAAITLAVIFLELGFKYKIHDARKRRDPNSKWDEVEKLNFAATIRNLEKLEVISKVERRELETFNFETRNPYIHYNLQKLVDGVFAEKMPVVDTETAEVTILRQVDVAQNPHLWFSGKKFRDKKEVENIIRFCIDWVNKALS